MLRIAHALLSILLDIRRFTMLLEAIDGAAAILGGFGLVGLHLHNLDGFLAV